MLCKNNLHSIVHIWPTTILFFVCLGIIFAQTELWKSINR